MWSVSLILVAKIKIKWHGKTILKRFCVCNGVKKANLCTLGPELCNYLTLIISLNAHNFSPSFVSESGTAV